MVRRSDRRRGSIYLGLVVGLFVISGVLVGGYFVSEQPASAPRARAGSAAPAVAGDHAVLA